MLVVVAPNENAELTYLQSLREAELRELVIIPLLTRMGYRGVRSVHGSLEFGKDVVFSQQDPLARERHYAVVVKKGPLTGSVSSSNSLRAAVMQVEQSFDRPFLARIIHEKARHAKPSLLQTC
jgi:hypothetical protein